MSDQVSTRRVGGWTRPVAVPADLRNLCGEVGGVVRLPLAVYSSGTGPDYAFDLDDEDERRGFYELVLTEGRVEDVCRYLDLAELMRLWPTLFLPEPVRREWEPRLVDQVRS